MNARIGMENMVSPAFYKSIWADCISNHPSRVGGTVACVKREANGRRNGKQDGRKLALEDAQVNRASGAQQRLGARSGLRNWLNEKCQSVHAAHHHRLTSGKRRWRRGVPD